MSSETFFIRCTKSEWRANSLTHSDCTCRRQQPFFELTVAALARPVAVALTVWGTGLYVWSGALYLVQAVLTVRTARQVRRGADR